MYQYELERWDLKPCELGDWECVKTPVSTWETWEQGLEAFVRLLSDYTGGGGGVVVTGVHLGISTASAKFEDQWEGTGWEIVLRGQ